MSIPRVDENGEVSRVAGCPQKWLDGRRVERHRVDRKHQILHPGGFRCGAFGVTLSAAREVDYRLDAAFLQGRHRHVARCNRAARRHCFIDKPEIVNPWYRQPFAVLCRRERQQSCEHDQKAAPAK